jgi:hypothetical protein
LVSHRITSKLTILYHADVIGRMERLLQCSCLMGCKKAAGEKHENLPVDAADRRAFDGCPLHFGPGAALENASLIANSLLRPLVPVLIYLC